MVRPKDSITVNSTSSAAKVRVVTLIDGVGPGGGERMAVETTATLDPEKFERTFCISRKPGPDDPPEYLSAVIERLRSAGVRVIWLQRDSRTDVLAWLPLLRLLRRDRIDVLHAHKFGANVWAAVIGRLAGVPVVVAHEHSWSFEGMPLRRALDRELIARACNVLIAVSREDRRRMIEVEGIAPDLIEVVPNGIPAASGPRRGDVRASLEIAADVPVVGTVSVLRPEKGIDVLIRAAALLKSDFPTLRLLIAGEGDRASCEALIRELRLEDTVSLLGLRTDVPDLLPAFQVAVCPSDREGCPLSVIEYMAAARAVVATRVGGVPDLIRDGIDGAVVPPRDPAALARAIGSLLREPGRATEMGLRARERQQREFTLEATVARLERLYERELRRAGRPGRGELVPA